jgi:hypothetical protein
MAALKASVAVPRMCLRANRKEAPTQEALCHPFDTQLWDEANKPLRSKLALSEGNVHSAVHVFDAQLWDKMMILDRIDSHAK